MVLPSTAMPLASNETSNSRDEFSTIQKSDQQIVKRITAMKKYLHTYRLTKTLLSLSKIKCKLNKSNPKFYIPEIVEFEVF